MAVGVFCEVHADGPHDIPPTRHAPAIAGRHPSVPVGGIGGPRPDRNPEPIPFPDPAPDHPRRNRPDRLRPGHRRRDVRRSPDRGSRVQGTGTGRDTTRAEQHPNRIGTALRRRLAPRRRRDPLPTRSVPDRHRRCGATTRRERQGHLPGDRTGDHPRRPDGRKHPGLRPGTPGPDPPLRRWAS